MSYEDKDWTDHQNHIGKFTDNCDYCEIAKEFGIWSNGEFITFKELKSWKGTDDGRQLA